MNQKKDYCGGGDDDRGDGQATMMNLALFKLANQAVCILCGVVVLVVAQSSLVITLTSLTDDDDDDNSLIIIISPQYLS